MQTFLPYPDFEKTARVLDYKRLGKMRVESRQIMQALYYLKTNDLYKIDKLGRKRKRGWLFHTATQMWVGYEGALALYCNTMIREWIRRGYKNTMYLYNEKGYKIEMPEFLGNKEFHLSHQSNLVRKKPEFYRDIFKTVPDNLPYIWPVKGQIIA
mgnify:CR=1 FL=1